MYILYSEIKTTQISIYWNEKETFLQMKATHPTRKFFSKTMMTTFMLLHQTKQSEATHQSNSPTFTTISSIAGKQTACRHLQDLTFSKVSMAAAKTINTFTA